MKENKGFSIELTSRYAGWWRYNAALMCGCFDAQEVRTGFCKAESHVADVGSQLTERPAHIEAGRSVVLETPPCDHLLLYVYIIPHCLPESSDIDTNNPFDAELRIRYNGRKLRTDRLKINQWSGVSLELRIAAE